MNKLTHFDQDGNAVMVDVSDKKETLRSATAKGWIQVSNLVRVAIENKTVKKGDVLSVAQVAGIMGAKQTHHLIPMCHPLFLNSCKVTFEVGDDNKIWAKAIVKTRGVTGVEMEALTAVSTALLTIYDMCKALDKTMEIGSIYLEEKTGGKSGDFINEAHRNCN